MQISSDTADVNDPVDWKTNGLGDIIGDPDVRGTFRTAAANIEPVTITFTTDSE